MNINEIEVNTRADFARFIEALKTDLENRPQDWENATLSDFLEALSRYTTDIQQYYDNTEQNINADTATWRLFADICKGARIYE
ncbi:hypothetical protein [Capnocytophaga sp.]|uniref:DUF7660 family protein n=1 Tax=Capnocytophaga sp. TaxID=44737 RepID=UPI0026DB75C4|nr:hypothetical protein [Capnocytophaga sp.]MDO5106093.1 hypothetical protein [Capnocytophaga sp.]